MITGGNYFKNTGSARFASNANFKDFLGVMIDGELVDAKSYKAFTGSTVIEFTQDFMNSFSNGEHTITILSKDGFAKTSFMIDDTPANLPATNSSIKGKYADASASNITNTNGAFETTKTGNTSNNNSSISKVVKTGDSTNMIIYIVIAIIAFVGIIVIKFRKNK
jgi:LPXTG-motif cell wall-anchored protein